jgi:hypothetical protein
MIPFSLGTSIISVVSGLILSKSGKYRVIMWVSYAVMTLGMGLMITLDYTSNEYVLYFRSLFTLLRNRMQRRKRDLPSDRYPWNRLFVPSPASCTSGCDALEGHGYRIQWLHVPPVSVTVTLSPSRLLTSLKTLSTVGGAVGIAVGEAIISTILPKKLAGIANISSLGLGDSAAALNDSVSKVHLIAVSLPRAPLLVRPR